MGNVKPITLAQYVKGCGSKSEAARRLGVGWQQVHNWLAGKPVRIGSKKLLEAAGIVPPA